MVNNMSETKEISLFEKESPQGVLETNIEELEKYVAEKLVEYTPENYLGDADAAKKDRAILNASKKAVSTQRISIIKKAMARFCIDSLETRCKKVEKDIDTAALALDAIVKIKEQAEKDEKRKMIQQFWDCQNFSLVSLDKVFDEKWLNKSTKEKDIFAEIEKKIADIYSGLKTIEAFGVDVDTLKPIFLESLDLGKTIEQGNRIKENREKLAKEEEERSERERVKKFREDQQELAREEVRSQDQEPIVSLAAAASGVEPDLDPEIEYTLKFKGKKSSLFALKQFMLDNKITYEKIEEVQA
jgi:hypothetical protein